MSAAATKRQASPYLATSLLPFFLPIPLPITKPTHIHSFLTRPFFLAIQGEEDRETITSQVPTYTSVCRTTENQTCLPLQSTCLMCPHSAIIAFTTRAVAARLKEQNNHLLIHQNFGGIMNSSYGGNCHSVILPVCQFTI